uniref:Uncharacterized protein n=1 Tax=Anopheles coluzzii TaxID=1518534 RepID=A0A8W7PMC2_ANOCL
MSVTSPSSIRTPPTFAPYAIPTAHLELFAVAATSPAHRVPCRFESLDRQLVRFGQRSEVALLTRSGPLLFRPPDTPVRFQPLLVRFGGTERPLVQSAVLEVVVFVKDLWKKSLCTTKCNAYVLILLVVVGGGGDASFALAMTAAGML